MPEGPSLVLLREEAQRFVGKTVRAAEGHAAFDAARMTGRRVRDVRTWGKHFLLGFAGFSLRVHLLLFGSWLIDARKPRPPRLALRFARGELNFYGCSLRYIEGELDQAYDWSADVLSDAWSPRAARRKLLAAPERPVCDVLLDQDIFAGVGNIIRNEVLFRIRVHPESRVAALPPDRLSALIREARRYSFEFLDWKRAGVLKRNWQVHARQSCPNCGRKLRTTYPGRTRRRTFFCPRCQPRYA
jgi:endonuclease VIII